MAAPHYYSDRLIRKLHELRLAPAAVVEAPSGYGKTTAVRDFLAREIPPNIPVYWFTAMDETPAAGYRRLCREIGKIDHSAGERLLRVDFPNAATIGEACDALRSIQCGNEAYLVIDNFQYLQNALLPDFFTALIEHGGKGLHIIMVTQMLKRKMLGITAGHGVLHIISADLRLDGDDITSYFALAGVSITREEAQEVARCSEGWIIAVYLQLCAFRDTGTFSNTAILSLMEHLVWDALTIDQQTFLLRLSPFEVVTMQQACTLSGCDALPEYAREVLGNPFIRYAPAERRYELHGILTELLVQKRKERGRDFEYRCLLRAGDYCRDQGITDKAFGLYAQIRDYERMLSLDLSHLILEDIGNTPFYELALNIACNCPYDLKKDNLLAMLRIAWALLTAGFNAEFDVLMEELRGMLEENGSEENSLLCGEWLLLSSWRRLPRLDEMTGLLQQAAPLFNGTCSRVILPTAPWCFGDYSQLAVFHSIPGEADREAEALQKYIALYSRLTNGHGSGADVLFSAELAHYRGNLNEAETLAYKASFLAESKQQSMVQLGAALHLAEIAVEKNDLAGWQNAISSMEQAASYPGQNNFVLRSAVDMLQALLLNELQHQNRIADWLKKGETAGRLLPAMERNVLFVRLGYSMHEGEFARLTGMAEAGREALRPGDVLTDILLSLLAAVGHISLGNAFQAEKVLGHAAEKALADDLVYLLAVYYWMLQGLPEALIRKQYSAHLAPFIEIKERFISGFTALHDDLMSDQLPGGLTAREREVALLAAQGLRNSEIARQLMVTENTVRFHLRIVFQKLDIDRRARLAEKLK
ncbi:MAG: LuxR C-terminal-related transcriptional regulator [Syntrophomonas sp.]